MSDLPPPSEPSPLGPSLFSPPLAVTGLLMLLSVFATSNPFFGTAQKIWPWEMLAQGHNSLLVEVVFLLWTATAFWCLGMAFSTSVRVRAIGTAMLALPLLIEASGGLGGLTIELVNINGMVPMMLMGGGFLIARNPATRGLGACLAGSGGILLVWALATGFGQEGGDARLLTWWNDFLIVLQDPGHGFERVNHIWWDIIPQGLVLLGAVLGVLALLGLRTRMFVTIAFWVVAVGVFFPGCVGIVLQMLEGSGLTTILREVLSVFIGHGALLWMVGSFTLQDFGKVRALAEAA